MTNKIVIDIQLGKNADKVKKAIKSLADAQARLNKTVVKATPPQEKLNTAMKKTHKGMIDITNQGRLVQNSFATIRSKLLLVSFGFGLVNASVVKLVKMFGEQELAEKRLTTALGRRSQALIDQAGALQQQTRFGDEAIIGAQAMLAAFIKEEEGLKKATQATLDLASAKGMDLNSAADLIAKSIGSSTNSLTRYGIEAEGAAGSTERLESIVKNIDKIFGGFAKGELNTTLGILSATGNAVGDAAENIGQVLAPAVESTARLLKSFAESISVEKVKALGAAITVATGAFVTYKAAVVAATIAQFNLLRAGAITLSLDKTAKAVMGATAAFKLLKKALPFAAVIAASTAIAKLGGDYLKYTKNVIDAKGVTSNFQALLVGLGIVKMKDVELTERAREAQEKYNNNLEKSAESTSRSKEEIEKNIIAMQKQLDLLELNASATSEIDQIQKMIIENGGSLTMQEYELASAIASVTVERERQKIAIKAQTEQMRQLKREQQISFLLQSQLFVLNAEVQGQDQFQIQTFNARANAVRNINATFEDYGTGIDKSVDLNNLLVEGIQKQSEWEGILTAELHKTNDPLFNRIKLILQILEAQEELINQNKTLVEAQSELNNEMSSEDLKTSLGEQFSLQGELNKIKLQEQFIADNTKMSNMEKDTAQNKLTVQKIGLMKQEVTSAMALGASYDDAGKAASAAAREAINAKVREILANQLASVFASVPFPANMVLAAASAGAVSSILEKGFSAMAAIKLSDFEQGGYVGGNRHAQGGTIIEAERGEFVMSRNAVESIGVDNLESMNAGGGASSIVINNPIISSEFVETELPELIAEAVRKGADFGMS
tara:strand:+ start:2769 stop:5285 length:2517 start_codon:yes stop_codon:yes gene_type:complete